MERNRLRQYVKNLVLAAMFMALGLVLPFLTGQIPQVGAMMLPMHLPVLLCGLVCGWQYGGLVGFVLPLLRHTLFGTPPLITATAMAFELAAYGMVAGFLYARSRWQCLRALYRCLIAAMIAGRLVWGGVRGAVGPGEAGVFLAGVPVRGGALRHPRHCPSAAGHTRRDGGHGPHGAGALPQKGGKAGGGTPLLIG